MYIYQLHDFPKYDFGILISDSFIISIQIYSAVFKVGILFEDWSTLRSNISVIYREDLVVPISSISQGHSNIMSENLAQNMHAHFSDSTYYKCPGQELLMSTQKTCFHVDIRKISILKPSRAMLYIPLPV